LPKPVNPGRIPAHINGDGIAPRIGAERVSEDRHGKVSIGSETAP